MLTWSLKKCSLFLFLWLNFHQLNGRDNLLSLNTAISTACMVCMQNQAGSLDFKSRPSPHCWVRRNSREYTHFHFGPVEGIFQGQRTTTKALSLHTKCSMVCPQRLKVRPLWRSFFHAFDLASLSSQEFRWVTPRWKIWGLGNAREPFFITSPSKWTMAPFKEGTHTFGSISRNPCM